MDRSYHSFIEEESKGRIQSTYLVQEIGLESQHVWWRFTRINMETRLILERNREEYFCKFSMMAESGETSSIVGEIQRDEVSPMNLFTYFWRRQNSEKISSFENTMNPRDFYHWRRILQCRSFYFYFKIR